MHVGRRLHNELQNDIFASYSSLIILFISDIRWFIERRARFAELFSVNEDKKYTAIFGYLF